MQIDWCKLRTASNGDVEQELSLKAFEHLNYAILCLPSSKTTKVTKRQVCIAAHIGNLLESLILQGEEKIIADRCSTSELLNHLCHVLERCVSGSATEVGHGFNAMILHIAMMCLSCFCGDVAATSRLMAATVDDGVNLERWVVCLANVMGVCGVTIEANHEAGVAFSDALALIVNVMLLSLQSDQSVIVTKVLREMGVLGLVLRCVFGKGRPWPASIFDLQGEILCRFTVLFGLVLASGSHAGSSEALAIVDEVAEEHVFERVGRWFCNNLEQNDSSLEHNDSSMVSSLLLLSLALVLCPDSVEVTNDIALQVWTNVKHVLPDFAKIPRVAQCADSLLILCECFRSKTTLDVDEWLDALLPSPAELVVHILKDDSINGCCSWCGNRFPKGKCSQCSSILYCNAECQILHWKRHRRDCVVAP